MMEMRKWSKRRRQRLERIQHLSPGNRPWPFSNAMKLPPGAMGALPQEIHTVWNSFAHGPGTIPQRHALRNAIVPRSAGYGHICNIDPDGQPMKKVRDIFEIKQRKVQMVGLAESEMLHKEWQGNSQGMQKAIGKGDGCQRWLLLLEAGHT